MLGQRLPGPTDYLYEIAGAMLWNNREAALPPSKMQSRSSR
jgi:hypothetical protein